MDSPALALGYYTGDGSRLGHGRFVTSDLASWGGRAAHARRMDSVINIRGRKVDPSEIEWVVSTLAGVEEVIALGVPHLRAGDQMLRVVIACRARPMALRRRARPLPDPSARPQGPAQHHRGSRDPADHPGKGRPSGPPDPRRRAPRPTSMLDAKEGRDRGPIATPLSCA